MGAMEPPLKTLRRELARALVENQRKGETALSPGVLFEDVPFYIDPARFPNSEVVLIDCTMTNAVGPAAWKFDNSSNAPNVHFWEYNSKRPDGTPVDVSNRLPGSKQLTQPQDAETISQYSDPAFVLGNQWNPRESGRGIPLGATGNP